METTEEYNFFEEIAEFVPNNMSRLASFLTALWVSSAAAQFGFLKDIKTAGTKEVQAALDPVEQTIAFIGGTLCKGVKPLNKVLYDKIQVEPDMSKLTLVLQTGAKIVTYNLSLAPTEIPKETWFNETDVLKIYIHGFTDNPTKSSFQTMRDAFASKGIVNILALDASSLIAFFYLRATYLVKFIGERVGAVLAALVKLNGLNPANIHLIGHSLGSHISGFAGQTFLAVTGSRLGRISGLDPAGPCFAMLDVKDRLSKDDAVFVDVIHTDAGVYGLKEQIGHVDHYPNGGGEQPGCLLQTCSHSRAWEFYAESVINATSFLVVKCDDYEDFRKGHYNINDTSIMGYNTSNETCGKYCLQTSDEPPYGRGELGLRYQNNVGLTRNVKDYFSDLFS